MFLLLLLSVSQGVIQIGLLTSSLTPASLTLQLSSNLPGLLQQVESSLLLSTPLVLDWQIIDFSVSSDESQWRLPSSFQDSSAQIILDATFSVRYSTFLSQTCLSFGLLHVVLARPLNTLEDETVYPNTLFAETCSLSQANAVLDLISKYSWENVGLVHDEDVNNSQMAQRIKTQAQAPVTVLDQVILDFEDFLDVESIAYRLQSTSKSSGARVIVVMAAADMTAQVLQAADISVMGGNGYAWILNSAAMENIGELLKSSFSSALRTEIGKSGALGLRAVDAMHELQDPLSSFLRVLTLVAQGVQTLGSPTGTALFKYILSNPDTPSLEFALRFDAQGVKKTAYNVYNVQNYAEVLIGAWDPDSRVVSISKDSTIVWPGFTSVVPNDQVQVIQLGLLYPGHDNEGDVLSIGREVRNGFELAVETINSDSSLLSGYQISPVYADTFLFPSLAAANLAALAPYNIIGFVGPHSTELCQAYLSAEALSTDSKPMVTYSASATTLSSAVNYPGLLQLVQPDGLQAVAITLFIQLQGWKTIGVIYTDDDFGQGVYSSFLANVGTLDVTIKNQEANRVVHYQLDSDGAVSATTVASIENALDDIVRNQIKVIVYLGNERLTPQLAKTGFAKELHGVDYSWVGSMWLTQSVLSDVNSTYQSDADNIMQVLNGAIGLDNRTAQGTAGEAFQSAYFNKYKEKYSTVAMLAYDAVLTYASVINGMIGRGDDYNSGNELTNSLRSADLTGASGTIKFSEGSNGRSAYGYNIVNCQNGELVDVLVYDPLNPNLFTQINNISIVWGGAANSPPVDAWPTFYDCPFAENMSKISPRGVGIVISIGAFLFLITLGLSFFSYNKWRQIEINRISITVVRSWKDTLVQAQIAIEFFQFIAIAPTFSALKMVVQAASNVFMLDIMKVANTSKGDYWILLSTICGLCYIWFLLVLLIMFNGEHWLKRVPFCKRTVSILNSVFLPFFGNTFFLPALALLLDMFVCDHQAQGHDYVFRDCYTRCWEPPHTTYMAMTIIAIICYEPIAAYSRPLWQQSRTGLNLKIQPFFLLLKTCMQILLIAIGKSLQSISPVAHGVVFTILISLFTVFIYKLQPFNYSRLNLWEFSSILAVAYLSFLATLSYSGDETNVAWFIALVVGWAIIAIGSLLVQRKYLPNLLIPPGGTRSKKKIYDIIAINKEQKEEFDDSVISKQADYKVVDESSIQVAGEELPARDNNEADDEAKPVNF